ncbi:MAG: hypothetical protein ABSB11_06950 [Sedimentisphaerales bacterium]|jgi:hypothetical protein
MKRLLLVFGLGLVFFVGCEQMNKTMASWVGHNFNEVVASWGPPQSIMDDGKGGKIMTWSYAQTITTSPGYANSQTTSNNAQYPGGTLDTHTTYQPPQTQTVVKTRTFWVDGNGKIYNWAWRGL